ncbi:MAG TPA: hypothetical protein PKK10_00160 [Woeseiaceae bacterium]|nr:hypothetical protein [Woeseiaceae bacterium]
MADDQPARIVDASDESRAALQQVVNEVLRTEVLLADDALTNSSVLTIERNIPRRIDGQPAQGRNMDTPIQFRLVKNGDACVLIESRDGARHYLPHTKCAAE